MFGMKLIKRRVVFFIINRDVYLIRYSRWARVAAVQGGVTECEKDSLFRRLALITGNTRAESCRIK